MTTRLDGPLKRELSIRGEPYTLTISPDGLHLVPKGRRKGQELRWADLVSGDAALATALNASLAHARPPAVENRPKSRGKGSTAGKAGTPRRKPRNSR